ncbi:MAG: hypothetical protein H8E41_04015 [Desulfobulbaceae bacterium]|uniref:Uncharacterized protein n=1 Tax=Candidatus Desulfobia pelagia TaxID=2841692 RepID=A0A8J6TF84_9BACT|nr:hypothetical protein [Candidatus Desulfobia pelagia]
MKESKNPQDRLILLFDQKKCWTIEELTHSLDYSSISIRRFLKHTGYYSSFTHNSMWYTLHSIPSFNRRGLWFYREIGFSRHGNLKQTISNFVAISPQGLTARELFDILLIPCHPVLNQMYNKNQLARFNTRRGFVYLSIDDRKRQRQLHRLQSQLVTTSEPETLTAQAAVYVLVEYIKRPEVSVTQLSEAVEKGGVKASPVAITRLFKEHDLKKTPM